MVGGGALWLFVVVTIVIIVVVVVLLQHYSDDSNKNLNISNIYHYKDHNDENSVDLYAFERFYRSTIWQTQRLRTDYNGERDIALQFVEDDSRILETLDPFKNAKDFAQLLRTLNAYGCIVAESGDVTIAAQLFRALMIIADKLPMPAPHQQLPWGFQEVFWNVFSICLTECAMLLAIVLRPYANVDEIALNIIENYIVEPNLSMGWRRNVGYGTRMCIPYIYAQINRGFTLTEIASQSLVAGILKEIRHYIHNGIAVDGINYVDDNVRNYSFLVENYFTFQYYNFLFGPDFIAIDDVHRSFNVVGSNSGRVHPALLYKNGAHVSPVIAEIMHYDHGVFTADFSKVVTVRNENYFASLVSPVNGVAYYRANYDYRRHALLWTMTKRIWSNDNDDDDIITKDCENNNSVIIDAGAIIIDDDIQKLPQNNMLLSSSMSFLPNPAFTAIASIDNSVAAIASFSKFDALNIEYYSYTLYYPTGMLQLYDRIKALNRVDRDAYCVVLMLKSDYDHDHNAVAAVDDKIYKNSRGYTVKHHAIENHKPLADFKLVQSFGRCFVAQTIPVQDINDGEGVACYSMATSFSNLAIASPKIIEMNKIKRNFQVTVNEIDCIFEFPYVLVKNNETRCVTLNNAYQSTKRLHKMNFEDIRNLLDQVGLCIDDLLSDSIERTDDAFVFDNSSGNQFKFYY
ncbi:occlusion-derived virus envelope protein e66 [Alphabaculovirus altersperidaniae]|uniref:Occlusion-derived virus envelope protein e66 n=1 Tax=Spodoptera eridania nucleopolyhedrovirus TaxID=2315721 RepID=A0ABX6TQ84_9ABAC|nr:occlusion-derived virus envelope protein e66 [Spodoptera eridania nucleopolyhedrovirus]QNV47904.1 occlusion-derived virus envelope protein e66 [Spodoptera eridania nucleopolyhedrovirus]